MDEARRLLARLDRIDALGQNQVPAATLLVELRALVAEAESWAQREGPDAEHAVTAVRSAVAGTPRSDADSSRPPPPS